jgi:competence protein ComEA
MQVDRVRNLVLISLVTGAWLLAIALEVRQRSIRARGHVPDGGTCPVPHGVGSASVRQLLCTGRMPVNCASARDLELLRGVGPTRASAIVEHRRKHGAFTGTQDLQNVRGIGPATASRLAGQVSFARRGTSCASRSP